MRATDELRTAWETHTERRFPFPTGWYGEEGVDPDPELEDLAVELDVYESFVAGVVLSVIALAENPYVDTLGPDDATRARLAARAVDPDPTVREDARALLSRVDTLHDLLAQAKRTWSEVRPKRSRR